MFTKSIQLNTCIYFVMILRKYFVEVPIKLFFTFYLLKPISHILYMFSLEKVNFKAI